jgi:hypothetical protein
MADNEHDEQHNDTVEHTDQEQGDFTQFVEGGSGNPQRVDESPNRDAIDGANQTDQQELGSQTHPLPGEGADRNAPYAPADHTPAGPNDVA